MSRCAPAAVLGFCLTVFASVAAAQTAPLAAESTASQRAEKLKERDRLWTEAQKLRGEGKLAAAIESGRKMLAIERAVLAEGSKDLIISLNWLANVAEQAEEWQAAEPLRVEALAWCTKHRGAEHWQTIDARLALDHARKLPSLPAAGRARLVEAKRFNTEVAQLYGEGKFAEALERAKAILAIHKSVLSEKHPDYALSLNDVAALYKSMGDYARAEPLYVEALAIRKEVLGEKHPSYALSLNHLAELYRSTGDYARAEPLYVEARAIRKEALGEKHPAYAASLNSLAALYYDLGGYARAEPLFVEALAIHKEVLGEKHPDYATSLNNLALLYDNMGDYARAEPLYVEAHAIKKEVLGEKHPAYALSLNNLALLYESMGDYARAEPLYIEALAIFKDLLGEKHPDYATSLNNLAALYQSMGDYARAEPLYIEARAIRKAALGEKHPAYATSLNKLAGLYRSMGDYARAEPLYIEARAIRKEVLGEKHPDYATSLNTLAGLYRKMGDYARAEPLYVEARAIRKEVLGEKHSDYATSLNNLALLYDNMGDYARAEPLYVEARAIDKEALGETHPSYATDLNNLAGLYRSMGDYARAEPLYVEARAIRKAALGEKHPAYALSLDNLAFLYTAMDRPAEAEPLYRQALAISRASLEATAAVQSERQQLAMGQGLRHQLDNYVSLGLNSEEFARSIFREVLLWKGSTLVRQRGMRLAGEDSAVADLFEQLQRTATQLASLSRAVPPTEDQQATWRERLTSLTHEKERLEARLSSESAAFRRATKDVSLNDLLAALPPDAVLVDYLEFTRSTPPKKPGDKTTWIRELVAFVVRPAEEPEDQVTMVSLGPVAPFSAAIDRWRTTFGVGDDAAAAGAELRKLVWHPVLEALKQESGTKNDQTILVSTDGVLGRLPLGALPGREPGTYLIEDHRLAMIPVPQLLPALVGDSSAKLSERELLLMGDVDYDSAPGAAATAVPKKKQPRRPGDRTRSPTEGILFDPLAGTAAEVAVLKELYGRLYEVNPDDPRSLVRAEADEAHFRELAPQYRHLHLATHGFFADAAFQSADSSTAAAEAARRQELAPAWSSSTAAPAPITGIGAALESVEGGARVTQIVPGGAAAADGRLKPGDVIQKVGQASGELVEVKGKTINDVVNLIRGAAGTKVRIEVLPQGASTPVVYELTRKLIPQAGATRSTSGEGTADVPDAMVVGRNPGLLSGLALAGANREPTSDGDDGILTSQEIGVLNLSGVDTVVLSACDTGLGETAGGEGLLGVQRAFQVAGARTTVASFWKVDDLVTRLLMERFYRNLWEGEMSRLDALREAQLYVLNHPEAVRGSDPQPDDPKLRTSPRLWAAFTLSGDWR